MPSLLNTSLANTPQLEFARLLRASLLAKSSSRLDQEQYKELRDIICENRREWVEMLLNKFLADRNLSHLRNNHGEDMLQEGIIALLQAIDGFDPEMGTQFSTYAERKVIGAFRHYLRDKLNLIRESACNQEKRAQTGETAPVRCEQAPNDEALDTAEGCNDIASFELRDAIRQAFQAWDIENETAIRSRRAVYATFFEDAKLADLANEFGVSVTQAHRYLRSGQARMREFLTEQGISTND